MTDTRGEAAALRALVGGKAAAPDIRTLRAVHTGLVRLPTEPLPDPRDDADAAPLAVRRPAS